MAKKVKTKEQKCLDSIFEKMKNKEFGEPVSAATKKKIFNWMLKEIGKNYYCEFIDKTICQCTGIVGCYNGKCVTCGKPS